jgi:parallel beta-helix repeat protein
MDNKRSSALAGYLILVSTLYVFLAVVPGSVEGGPIHVGGSGPGNYTTIQEAIDVSDDGDTILIHSGTYVEQLRVAKSITLTGENKETTVIDGDGIGDVINVTADWVNITGLTVANSGPGNLGAGIGLYNVNNCNISENNASRNYWYGIVLYGSSNNEIASNNFSSEWGVGPHIKGIGMYLTSSSNNLIIGNNALNSSYGLGLWFSEGNNISHNDLDSNEYGVALFYSNNSTIVRNRISFNELRGIKISHTSSNNTVADNYVSGNRVGIGLSESTSSNRVYHNTFIDNIEQAGDSSVANEWDSGYPIGGNYWSDYEGIDRKSGSEQNQESSDGIGDSSYSIQVLDDGQSLAKDRYPLMSPFVATPSPIGSRPPICGLTSPDQRESISGAYAVAGFASDTDGNVTYVEIRIDDNPWVKAEGTTSWVYTWNTKNVPNGNHSVYARSFDGTSYSPEAEVTVEVNNPFSPEPFESWLWILVSTISILIIAILLMVFIWRKRSDDDRTKKS